MKRIFYPSTSTEMEKVIIRTTLKRGGDKPSALKDLIVNTLDSDKALDIEIINLNTHSALADYMVIASGTSSRQVIRLADKLKDRLLECGVKDIRLEGQAEGNWVILDAGDVIVHLFRPEVRDFYQIEKMWSMPFLPSPSSEGMLTA